MHSHTQDEGPVSCHQRILTLIRENQLQAAAERCRQLNDLHPGFAPGWITAGYVFQCLGRHDEALRLAERALTLEGGGAQLKHSDSYSNLGLLYTNAGKFPQALAMYHKAASLQPGNPAHLFNRATLRRFVGDLTGAEADYDQVIALNPRDYEACFNRSELRRQSVTQNHTKELEHLLESCGDRWSGRVQLHYALAKEYEDLQQWPRAFGHLQSGAALRRRHLQYDVQNDLDIIGAIIRTFTGEARAERPSPPAARKPIFVFGLPRSGTTLVERILGCHSAVFPAGELNDFASSVVDIAAGPSGPRMPATTLVQRSAQCDFGELGRRYLARIIHRLGDEEYFTDKMPLNFLYCGLIAASLPEAKLVHVVRHPMAVCFAMYKTLFKQGYPFSYAFSDIARYYVAYRALMEHWSRQLPGRILEVSYERLVFDQQEQSKRILSFCGLPWEDRCLEFHKSAYPSSTASASQVRRPLYQSAVALWREYSQALTPLRDCLLLQGMRPGELD